MLHKTVDIQGKTSPPSPDSLVLFESTFHSSLLLVKPFLCRWQVAVALWFWVIPNLYWDLPQFLSCHLENRCLQFCPNCCWYGNDQTGPLPGFDSGCVLALQFLILLIMLSDISAGWLFEHPLNKQAQRLYWEMILDLYLSGIRAELAFLLTHW